ncbi:MAG: hypothetical protein Q4C95_06310 [Planctomycetia bacterium]|nr:hypothetical protein [Planctomycetia bacterium]
MSGTNLHRLPGTTDDFSPLPSLPREIRSRISETASENQEEYHNVRMVRRNQNISLANCARRLGLTTAEARYQEQPSTDLSISQLMAWKDVLDIPLVELLPENEILNNPIRNRALLVKVMKTAKQILQTAKESRIHNMAITLVDQLVHLMPELREVSSWPEIGQSHENRDYGVAAYRRFDVDIAEQMDYDSP